MKSLNRLFFLAAQFDQKLQKYSQEVAQSGTTELFFDNEDKQRAFASAIQDQSGPVGKVLLAIFNKTQAAVSFDLKATATPGQSASWNLTVNPPTARVPVQVALDKVFQSIVGGGMSVRQQTANAKAKAGSGSGVLNIGLLDLS
jgi:hypothetical protein